jgi:hypothetical protein
MNAEINTWAKNIDWTKLVLAFALGAIVGAIGYREYLARYCCLRNGQWYCPCPSPALPPSDMGGGVFIAVAVGLVVLAISFGLVGWAQKEDQGQKKY